MDTYQVKVVCSRGCENDGKVVVNQDYLGSMLPAFDGDFMIIESESEGGIDVPFDCPVCGSRRLFITKVVEKEKVGFLTAAP